MGKAFKRVLLRRSVLFPEQRKYTIVDTEDYERAKVGDWWPQLRGDTYYAGCRGKYLHRIIMRARKGQHVDHRDGNGLDNRKNNLRKTNRSGNERNRNRINRNNTSGVAGVCRNKGGKWEIKVSVGNRGRSRTVATVSSLREAAEVRRCAEVLVYGEFAPRLRPPATGRLVGKFKNLGELMAFYPRIAPIGRSGIAGVAWSAPGWRASHQGKYLGWFKHASKAEQAVAKAKAS